MRAECSKLWRKYGRLKDMALALMPPNPGQNFHVSFILHKNRVVAVGVNNKKTHPTNLKNPKFGKEGTNVSSYKYTCSELNAFVKLKNLTNVPFHRCTLVNFRVLRNGDLGLALPCQSCRSLISYLNLKNVLYTDHDGSLIKYSEQ
jgi:deoxycytidylate deaminase